MSAEHKEAAQGMMRMRPFALRSGVDRRTGDDRRDVHDLEYFEIGHERRSGRERRALLEQRLGWVRVSRWHSICVSGSPCGPPGIR